MSEIVRTTENATLSIARFYSQSDNEYMEWDELYNDWSKHVACEIQDEEDLMLLYAFCRQIAGMDKLKISQIYKTAVAE